MDGALYTAGLFSNKYHILSSLCEPLFPSELRVFTITENRQTPSITLQVKLIGKITGRKINAQALLDSGAEDIIINSQFTKIHNLTLLPIPKPFPIQNIDGSENILGWVRHYTRQKIRIPSEKPDSYHDETAEFYITDIGDNDIILGTDWLQHHNPEVNWVERSLGLTRCPSTCITKNPPVRARSTVELPKVVPHRIQRDY